MGMIENAEEIAFDTIHSLFEYIENKRWKQVKNLLSEEFEVYWPQFETQSDCDGFIDALKSSSASNYKIEITNIHHQYDCWEHSSTVIVQAHIKAKPQNFFIIDFFEVMDIGDKVEILELTEYRIKTYKTSQWTKQQLGLY